LVGFVASLYIACPAAFALQNKERDTIFMTFLEDLLWDVIESRVSHEEDPDDFRCGWVDVGPALVSEGSMVTRSVEVPETSVVSGSPPEKFCY
jgi:hypothetical protein